MTDQERQVARAAVMLIDALEPLRPEEQEIHITDFATMVREFLAHRAEIKTDAAGVGGSAAASRSTKLQRR